ncbi:uncharacterized protein BN742_01336 [Firmicutes bacterium CAG:631]|nr:uncharacterized protein BN742_01336 [Firmicutes bacterium CAG:631]
MCSLKDNENLSENIIKYPKYLFRYKSLTIDSLADIKNNKLKFSTSNYYDDPFDTFLKINQKKLFESIDDIFKQENFLSNLEFICKQLGMEFNKNEISKKINSFDIKSFHSQIISLIRGDIRNILRSYTLSACFSENGLNETLWIKYANQHKGFALIYDLENKENYLCGKEEKFNNCSFNHFSHPLYPVYYSNKSYDATEYAKWFTTFVVLKEYVSKNDIVDDKIFKLFPKMSWEKEKITLIKKKCHMYDQEWRMISNLV